MVGANFYAVCNYGAVIDTHMPFLTINQKDEGRGMTNKKTKTETETMGAI